MYLREASYAHRIGGPTEAGVRQSPAAQQALQAAAWLLIRVFLNSVSLWFQLTTREQVSLSIRGKEEGTDLTWVAAGATAPE